MRTRILNSVAVTLLSSVLVIQSPWVNAQEHDQLGDPNFDPPIANPAYPEGTGLRVVIDEAHYNWHTVDGRFQPFTKVLRKDGYLVEGLKEKLSLEVLKDVGVLVISNPINEANSGGMEKWVLPTPSAFTTDEIDAVVNWVSEGGSLLLVADHLPFGGAAEELALRFGFILGNGYAVRNTFFQNPMAPDANLIKFWREDSTVPAGDGYLQNHPIIEGRDASEKIEFVTSFTGEAFLTKPGTQIRPLMVLGEGAKQVLPIDQNFNTWPSKTNPKVLGVPSTYAEGMLQGATLNFGKGRMVMMGEAGMLTAQLAGNEPNIFKMGMNNSEAPHNVQFLLNVMHWLTGILPNHTPKKSCEELGKSAATIIDGDLTTQIPCATYKTPFGDMFLNILLHHVPDEKEPLLFRVKSAVEVKE